MEEDIKNNKVLLLPVKCGFNYKYNYLYTICFNQINKLITKFQNDTTNTQ
jgi:hypothetical protein